MVFSLGKFLTEWATRTHSVVLKGKLSSWHKEVVVGW